MRLELFMEERLESGLVALLDLSPVGDDFFCFASMISPGDVASSILPRDGALSMFSSPQSLMVMISSISFYVTTFPVINDNLLHFLLL